jgi:amino acid transporter
LSGDTSQAPAYVRKASGLVRELNARDFAFFNLAGFGLFFSLFYWLSLTPLIGGNYVVGFSLFVVAALCVTLIYYCFMVIMPRSGGDYVFVSRALHPAIGFIGNLTFGVLWLLFVAVTAVTITSTGVTTFFGYVGVVYNLPVMTSIATTMNTPVWTFVLGAIWMLLGALIAIPSLRVYLRVQQVIIIIVVATYIVGLVCLAAATPSGFTSTFNNYASQYTGNMTDHYNAVISAAASDGWNIPDQTSLWGSILLLPAFGVVGFFQWNANVGGEIRSPKKTALYGLVVGAMIFLGLLAVATALLYRVAGFNFLSSIDYLLFNDPSKVPLPMLPYAGILIALCGTMPPYIGAIYCLVPAIQQFLFNPSAYLVFSRGLFAYSFDGVLPKWFANVNSRTKGPLNAIVTSVIVSFILFVIVELPSSSSYAFLFSSVFTWVTTILPTFFVALSAILLFKLRPQLNELSPIKGIKLVIPGVISIVFIFIITYLCLTNPIYGANSPIGIYTAIGVVIAIGCVYLVSRIRKGRLLELSFKEIPPA